MVNKTAKQMVEDYRKAYPKIVTKWKENAPASKPWYTSKSLLIAGITIALAGLGAYRQGGDPVSIAIVVLGALSAAVRTVTSTRLTK